jgi:ankyrin repeat protein
MYGADLTANDNPQMKSPLHVACEHGREKVVRVILKQMQAANCDNDDEAQLMNGLDQDGNTPLHFAVRYEYKEIADLLLKAGADKEITNKFRLTPFSKANLFEFTNK